AGLEGFQKNIARLEVERQERNGKLENLSQRRRSEELLHRETHKKLEKSLQLELDLNSELENLTSTSGKLEERLGRIRIEIDESVEREEANKAELKSLAQEQDSLLEELKRTAQKLIEELEEHKLELTQNESRLTALREAIRSRLNSGGKLVEDAL